MTYTFHTSDIKIREKRYLLNKIVGQKVKKYNPD